MSRKVLLTLLGCLSFALASCNAPLPTGQINLNAAGAMEKLRTSNPKHYERIQQIVNGLGERQTDDVPRWIQTTFEAKDVSYSAILLVTHPPQRDLSFVLEGTMYRAVVTLDDKRAKIYPIKHQ